MYESHLSWRRLKSYYVKETIFNICFNEFLIPADYKNQQYLVFFVVEYHLKYTVNFKYK